MRTPQGPVSLCMRLLLKDSRGQAITTEVDKASFESVFEPW
jgi:hypothetical protein